jgi:hypothetical protein
MNNLTNNLNLSDPLTNTMNNLTNNLNLSEYIEEEQTTQWPKEKKKHASYIIVKYA